MAAIDTLLYSAPLSLVYTSHYIVAVTGVLGHLRLCKLPRTFRQLRVLLASPRVILANNKVNIFFKINYVSSRVSLRRKANNAFLQTAHMRCLRVVR